jgi:hypothetical protein
MDKQKVRDWMQKRQKEVPKTPPPTQDEIRRQLGPVPPTKR